MIKNPLLALFAVSLLFSFDLARVDAVAFQSKQDSPELAEASQLSQKVVKLYGEKKYDEAIQLAKRALELREKALGQDDPLVVSALNNLALIYMATREYSDAEALYARALAAQEKTDGADSPKAADAIENLAWARYGLGKVSEATSMFERALAIREKALGPFHADTGHALYNLARLHEKQGRPDKSLPFFQRALEVKEKALGPNHKEVGVLLDNYACALNQAGKEKEADELQKRAYTILRGDELRTEKIAPVASGVLKGKIIERHTPIYPEAARRARITGRMIVEVKVDETGKVIEARAKCGPDIFVNESVEAARRWRFTPTTLGGQPVKVIGTITFNYVP